MLSYEGDRVARIEEKFVGLARNENQLQVDLIWRYLPGGHFLLWKERFVGLDRHLPLKKFLIEAKLPKPYFYTTSSGQSPHNPPSTPPCHF